MTEKRSRPPGAEYQWRYLHARHINVRHLVQLPPGRRPAVCGVGPAWYQPDHQTWRGIRNEAEYETLKSLPACKNCVKKDPR